MAVPTINRYHTLYLGKWRVMQFETLGAGDNDTQELPHRATATDHSVIKALSATPLVAGSTDATLRVTSVGSNRPTVTFDGGAEDDTFHVRVWT